MFTAEERERLRADLLATARTDRRISGAAITGSASIGREDRWSDIDLAFGIGDPARLRDALDDWTALMYDRHGAVHHVDVLSGAWVYRVFLLRNTLQVDLAFAPAAEFGARAPTFQLVFGAAAELPHRQPPAAEQLIGMAWLYALHARSSITRGQPWQAEYMISAVRDHTLALACLRHGLPAAEGRGMDRLPADVVAPLRGALVSGLDADELVRALGVAMKALQREIRHADAALARRLEATIDELAATARP